MLVPREHGAYGQLLFPLVSALLIGRPEEGAYLLAGAAAAAFLAHEPLLVVLGQRGVRAAREQRADAQRSLALFGTFWLVSGIVAVVVMSRQALLYLLVPIMLAAVVAIVVFMHRERSTGGELLVATTLTSASLPVAIAGDVGARDALTLFAVFASVFATATVAVRGVIGRVARAGGPPLAAGGALAVGVVAGLAALAEIDRLAPVAPYAALPVCAVGLALTIKPPSPRYLRPIGWTLVGATTATALILVAALA